MSVEGHRNRAGNRDPSQDEAGGVRTRGQSRGSLRGMHIVVALKRLGLDDAAPSPLDTSLDDLGPTDFPTIVLLKDGSALILLGRNEDGRYLAETLQGLLDVRPEKLERHYSGRRLHVAAKLDASVRIEALHRQEASAALARQEGVFVAMLRRCRHSRLLRHFLLSRLLGNMLGVAPALFAMAVFDRIPLHEGLWQLTPLLAGIGIALLFELLVRIISGRLGEGLAADVTQATQASFYRHLTRLELNAMPTGSAGVAAAMQAMDRFGQLLPELVQSVAVDLPFSVLVFAYIGWLGGGVLLIAPMIAIVLMVAIGLVAMLSNARVNPVALGFLTKRASMIEETISQREQIRATGAAYSLSRVWDDVNDEAGFAAFRQRFTPAVAEMFINRVEQAAWIGLLAFAAWQDESSDVSSLGALMAAVLLTARAVRPTGQVMLAGLHMQSLRDSLRQADRLAVLPQERAGDETLAGVSIKGEVTFSDVVYTHPGEKIPAIDGVSFQISPGERVGIIGSVGSGKTTLGRMMLRLLTADEGRVTVDGLDIAQFDPDELRRHIAYMPQDCELFDLSLRNNVAIGLPEVDEAILAEAYEISGLKAIAARRAAGFAFKAGPQGRRLSSGERQAVMIARTLARKASIYVMDEPTSAMDGQFERELIQRLKARLDGKTVVVITHRAPVLALVDRVIWLDRGRVLADAPAKDVIREMGRSGG